MGVIIRQSIKGTITNYVGVAIGFVTTFFVLTRFLTAEEIGLTRVLIDTAALLSALAQLGTGSSIVRYYPYFKDKKGESTGDHGFFFWTLVVPLVGFAIIATLYIALREPIQQAFAAKSPLFVDYYYAVLPLAFFMLYMTVFESNASVLMRITVTKFSREVLVRVLALCDYLLYAFGVLNLQWFVYCFCGIYGIATVVNVAYVFSLKKVSLKPDFKHISRQLRNDYLLYTLFLIASAFATALTPVVSTFFISAQQGLAFTGVFAVATYIAAVIEIPYRSLGAIALPQLSQTLKDGDTAGANALCKKVSLHQFVVGLFIFFVVWINIDLFFRLLPNGEQYAVAKWVVFILGITKLINSSLSVGTSVLNYSKFYYFSLIFAALQTVLSIIFNNFLITIWGINGAAAATLFATLLYYATLLVLIGALIRTSPFSVAQLKVVTIFIALFALDAVCRFAVSHFLPDFDNLWLQCAEAVVRTVLLTALGIFVIYRWRISDEINLLLERFMPHIFKKK